MVESSFSLPTERLEVSPNTKILVCVGTGGVGKTSVAAAVGLSLAKKGKKILVLTIDPSKRLRTSLGFSEEGTPVRVWNEDSGELWGMVVNPQKTFDEFIRRAASNSDVVTKIQNNKLYQQLSTTLSGSQEFTALEVLFQNFHLQKYDHIILDTPPSQHAMEFLNAPQKLMSLFNEKVSIWFREERPQNLFSKIMHSGTNQILNAIEKLTGSEFMKELRHFFVAVEEWRPSLEKRVADVQRLLSGAGTEFLLVTTLDQLKWQTSEKIYREVKKEGYRVHAVVINSSFPIGFEDWKPVCVTEPSLPFGSSLFGQYEQWQLQKIELLQRIRQSLQGQEQVLVLPELDKDVSDLNSLDDLAKQI